MRIEELLSNASAAATHARSWIPEEHEIAELRQRLEAAPRLAPVDPDGRKMVAQVGLDFGTTSTKMVISLPYHSGTPAFAVPVPSFALAEDHPHLWTAQLWISNNETFSLWPTAEAVRIDNIKRNLMLPGISTFDPETAGCAFLALQLRQALGWMKSARPEVLGTSPIDWYINFGFPAASLDDKNLAERFRRVCAGALVLNASGTDVSVRTVVAALRQVGADPIRHLHEFGGNLVPEIAAAVAGFAYSARLEMGLFGLIDIGGTTIDCCTFNLYAPTDGDLGCFIFAAEVKLLGVEPWRLCRADDAMRREFMVRLQEAPRAVVRETRQSRYQRSPRWQEGLPVFITGGGAASEPHVQAITSMPIIRVQHLEPPQNLDHSCVDAGQTQRLNVAVGLSRPFYEIPTPQLPHEIPDDNSCLRNTLDDRYIGAEMT